MPETNLGKKKTPKQAPQAENAAPAVETIEEFLPDGHPNPKWFQKDGEGFEAIQQVLDDKGQWGEYMGKLYRVAPLKSMGDKPARVCKFASTLTLDDIEKKWGGRKWSAWITRRVGTRDKMVGIFQFDIEAAPIYHDDEKPDSGSNNAAAVANNPMMDKLIDDLMEQRDAAIERGEGFDMGDALSNALQLQNKGFSAALTAITANLGKGDDKLIALLTALLPNLLKREENPTEKVLLEKLMDRALAAEEPEEDPLDRTLKYLDALERLRPRSGSSRGSEWAQVGMTLVQSLPQILQNGTDFLRQAVITRSQFGPVIQAPAIPRQPAIAGPAAAPTPTPAAPQATPPANAQQAPQDQRAALYARAVIIERVKRVIAELAAQETENPTDAGKAAADVAELMDPEFAHRLAGALQDNPASLAQDPILSACVALPHIREFAAGYLAYFQEGQEQPEPPAATAEAAG